MVGEEIFHATSVGAFQKPYSVSAAVTYPTWIPDQVRDDKRGQDDKLGRDDKRGLEQVRDDKRGLEQVQDDKRGLEQFRVDKWVPEQVRGDKRGPEQVRVTNGSSNKSGAIS